MRLNIFLSKVQVIRESPGAALMLADAKVGQSVAQLAAFGQRAERALSGTQPDVRELQLLLTEMRAFTADSLAMANDAYILGTGLLETQNQTLLRNNLKILLLTGGQLLLLVILAWGLMWRSRIQQREEKARMVADQAHLSKGIFLANLSHELRTPFNGVMGLLCLLSKTPLSPEQADLVKVANDSAQHLSRLLNDTLDLSSLEAGNVTFTMEPVHLAGFLRSIEAIFRPLAEQKDLQFEITNTITIHSP